MTFVGILEDDPTGTQAVADVPVVLSLREQIPAAAGAAYIVTNSRAYPPERAREVVAEAAAAVVASRPGAQIVLRGDSTLRGHLLEEYDAVRATLFAGRSVPLLLVPALPSAHRITFQGVHYLDEGGRRTPVAETEYARDGVFAYRSSDLAAWADERSCGAFGRDRASRVPLTELRRRGADAVVEAVEGLATEKAPAVCIPDAVTLDDIEAIAAAVEELWTGETEFVVRCAPALAAELAHARATHLVSLPALAGPILVVVGSYVTNTGRQLAALLDTYPGSFVEVDVTALAADDPGERSRAASEASERLARLGLAVLTTPRERHPDVSTLKAGERVAINLARLLHALDVPPALVIAKGGITSAVVAREGLGAKQGRVVGPLAEGVALWELQTRWGTLPYVVVPGNVGGADLLRNLLDRARETKTCA